MSRMILLAVVMSIGFARPAPAQSILEVLAGIKFCRTLKDDTQRLKCFDGLVPEATAAPEAGKPDVEINWTVKEDKSPLDDSPQITASLASVKNDAMLILRCKEKATEVIFAKLYGYLGSNAVRVLVRINDGKLIETRWSTSTDGKGAFAPSAVQFIRALPDTGKLFIRAFNFSGTAEDGEFSLGKVSEVREKIAQACHWK